MADTFVALRRELHQIPEPGFEEFKTQALILDYLQKLPQDRLLVRTWRTGILVRIKGKVGKRLLAYRTDMDGLPIEEETGCSFRSTHPGYMHACGHDMHMAIALGVLTRFVEQPIADDMLIIFQPAEEGPGGAAPMLASDEFRTWKPDLVIALHIAPGYPVGTVATRPGVLFANAVELFIDLIGKGGHAAMPHQSNDMIIAASQLVMQLQTVVSRRMDPLNPAVLTIGKMEAGSRGNIIAERARLEGTIRTLTDQAMAVMKKHIESTIRGIESGFDCKADFSYGADYQRVYNHEALTAEFMDWVSTEACGDRSAMNMRLVECKETMTGEDFGYFLNEIPGFMFWLGVDTPYGLHHARIEPNEAAIDQAIELVARYLSWKSGQSVKIE